MSVSEKCSYPQLCQPNGEYGQSLVVKYKDGPYTKEHTVHTNYTIDMFGINIPVIVTNRFFKYTYSIQYGVPTNLKAFREDSGTIWLECSERHPDIYTSSISEDCTIIKSTLHYLDHRYSVCLYRELEWHLDFDVAGRLTPTRFKLFMTDEDYHKIIMKKQDLSGYRVERWCLINNGAKQIISEIREEWTPYFQIAGGKIWNPEWKPDSDVVQGFVFPQPPSTGICIEDEISYYGFYDYSNDGDPAGSALNRADGGCMDFFYPDWCRQMHEDPFWRYAADRRFMISWYHDEAVNNNKYVPPPITVDPLPVGSFVKHPHVGEVYQWLLQTIDGENKVITSQNFNTLIDGALPENTSTHSTTLYYPIGVI